MPSLNDLKKTKTPPSRRRKPFTRWLIPAALLALVVVVLWLIFGDILLPRQQVEIASAVLLETETTSTTARSEARAVAQASGWIEPDPFPAYAAAQTIGTVLSVEAYSGTAVTNGQVLATLDPADARLAFHKQVHLQETALKALAVQEAAIELAREQLASMKAELRQADSARAVARDTWKRISMLEPGDLSESERVAASNRVTQLEAQVDTARAGVAAAAAEIRVQEARRDADKTAVDRAETDVALARLHLDRTTVRSPMDGIVLERLVQPGAQLEEKNNAVVSLYDPMHLQVRVDVPLSDIRHVKPGQAARISSGAFGGVSYDGVVTRVTGVADIARNTLQVKVKILKPDLLMRPEMLCRVEFLPPASEVEMTSSGGQTLWIPEAALVDRNQGSAEVWVVDPVRQTVSKTTLETRDAVREGLVQVVSGLNPGAKVVVQGQATLAEGVRVKFGDQP